MKQFVVRVIDRKAQREHATFLEVALNLHTFANSKQEARKNIHKQLTAKGLVYGRDFALGSVGNYTARGVSVGFVGDNFKNCLPHHTFIAYKTFQETLPEGKKSDVKNETYKKVFLMKARPDDLNQPSYICSHGEFVTVDPEQEVKEEIK